VLFVGLTGGIGSGKSTFAALLSELGAEVIDADQLGRDALLPGEPAWHSVVGQFGDEILEANGLDIDRKALARIVFSDPQRLVALNAIVHPVITSGIADALEPLQGTAEIAVLDAALIVELGLDSMLDLLIVVTAPQALRQSRLQRDRGMTKEEISARIGAQISEEELVQRADIIVQNGGSLASLEREADRVWRELRGRHQA
jgi:dephospho-CoA kinase